ncbi:MAG TPA: D-Ala-D-Ala carboxypeptidase family metallohydrolase [Candidatus Gracilibacteria bacterium]|nr:D-Ala-D-Ala carboxypeptidase family metallohydrolase [Candidatus Gracilibacteria bacterium]
MNEKNPKLSANPEKKKSLIERIQTLKEDVESTYDLASNLKDRSDKGYLNRLAKFSTTHLPRIKENQNFKIKINQNHLTELYISSGDLFPPQVQAIKINGQIAERHSKHGDFYQRDEQGNYRRVGIKTQDKVSILKIKEDMPDLKIPDTGNPQKNLIHKMSLEFGSDAILMTTIWDIFKSQTGQEFGIEWKGFNAQAENQANIENQFIIVHKLIQRSISNFQKEFPAQKVYQNGKYSPEFIAYFALVYQGENDEPNFHEKIILNYFGQNENFEQALQFLKKYQNPHSEDPIRKPQFFSDEKPQAVPAFSKLKEPSENQAEIILRKFWTGDTWDKEDNGKYSLENLQAPFKIAMASLLQAAAREGKNLKWNSGFRPSDYNHKIGGAKNSLHTLGLAMDLIPPRHGNWVKNFLAQNYPRDKYYILVHSVSRSEPDHIHVQLNNSEYKNNQIAQGLKNKTTKELIT